MKYLILLCIFIGIAVLLMNTGARAKEAARSASPMLYQRTGIALQRAEITRKSAEGQEEKILPPPLAFTAEVREGRAASQMPGWFSFASLREGQAALLLYADPVIAEIGASSDYAPVDVLFLNIYGEIMQIAPKLIPAELESPIRAGEPVTAVMYLKGGSTEALGIAPGDRVEHTAFKKRPVVVGK